MIKACFFDMDGTLLSHTTKSIPQSTIKALYALQNKGIHIVLATGRHPLELKEMPGYEIPFDGYILLNGHLCLNKNKEVLYTDPITGPDKTFLVDLFNKKEIPIMLVEKDRFYCNLINEEVKLAQEAISSPLPDVSEYEGADLLQILPYVENIDTIKQQCTNCTITRWHQYGYDINMKGKGKVGGIQKYLQKNNLKQEEIMVFGDAQNDQEMLRFASIGVAMGNSDEETKKCADYVTTHVDEDGIINALKHFNIL